MFLKVNKIAKLSVIMLLTLFATTSWAATYYVAKNQSNASDSNSGSESNPFKTIQEGINHAYPGDTVYVKEGVYYEYILLPRSGTASNRIIIKKYGNDSVVVDGSNHSNYRVVYWGSGDGHDYITWELDVRNGSSEGIWVEGDYVTIQNCKVYNCKKTGITITESDHLYMTNVESYDNDWNGVNCQSSTNSLVENCIFRGNWDHYGFQFFHDTSKPAQMWTGNVLKDSVIYGNNNGIYLRYQEDGAIINNIIYDNAGYGIQTSNEPGEFSTYEGRTKIYNNTIVDNLSYAINNEAATKLYIKNNIIASNGGGILDGRSSSNHVIDYNLYYNNATLFKWGSNTYSTISNLQSAIGYEAHGLVGNPYFNDALNRDYTLKSSSLAIDKGANLSTEAPATTKDLIGTQRPQNLNYDIGAYEYKSGTTTTTLSAPTNLRIIM